MFNDVMSVKSIYYPDLTCHPLTLIIPLALSITQPHPSLILCHYTMIYSRSHFSDIMLTSQEPWWFCILRVRVQSGGSSWAQWGRLRITGLLSSMPEGPQLTTGLNTVWLPSDGNLTQNTEQEVSSLTSMQLKLSTTSKTQHPKFCPPLFWVILH